jgi:AraC-like DNA-binding protein
MLDSTQPRSRTAEPQAIAPPPGALHYSLHGVPDRERHTRVVEFFESLGVRYDIERLPDVPLEVDVKLQALPGVLMMSGTVYGSNNRQTRQTIPYGDDSVGMLMNLKGPHRLTQGQHEMVLAEGEATIVSTTDPWGSTHLPPGHILALRFPRTRLAPLVTGLDDCYLRRIPCQTPALTLLKNYVKIAGAEQTLASPALQHAVASHIYDLSAVAIGATRDAGEAARGGGVRAARLHAIKEDIARNLGRAELSVAGLAARHRCSPRFIQRLFEAEGTTFTDYLLAQRLVRAHRLLSDPRRVGEKISSIAFDAGFADLSYFNRAFRQCYGDTPSAVRAGLTLN